MQYRDYYEILGVTRGADADEVKRAYRKLARKFHPDVSKEKNAEAKFKEVQEAYEVLRDRDKRAAYDQLGRDFRNGQQFRPPPDWSQRFGQLGRPAIFGSQWIQRFLLQPVWRRGPGRGCRRGSGNSGKPDPKQVTWTSPWRRHSPAPSGASSLNEQRSPAPGRCANSGRASPTDSRLRIPGIGGRTSLIFRIRLRAASSLSGGRQGRSDRIAPGALGGCIGGEGRGPDARRHRGVDACLQERSPARSLGCAPGDFRAARPATRWSPSNW